MAVYKKDAITKIKLAQELEKQKHPGAVVAKADKSQNYIQTLLKRNLEDALNSKNSLPVESKISEREEYANEKATLQ